MDYGELVDLDLDMSKAIYEVYINKGKDHGDFVENLCLLRKRLVKSSSRLTSRFH